MTREELATMTDQELLAYEREHHDDPDMTVAKAIETQRLALQFWASGGRQQEGGPGGPEGGATSPASAVASVHSAVLGSKRRTRLEKRHDDGSFT
jgi:hypothetical protein